MSKEGWKNIREIEDMMYFQKMMNNGKQNTPSSVEWSHPPKSGIALLEILQGVQLIHPEIQRHQTNLHRIGRFFKRYSVCTHNGTFFTVESCLSLLVDLSRPLPDRLEIVRRSKCKTQIPALIRLGCGMTALIIRRIIFFVL